MLRIFLILCLVVVLSSRAFSGSTKEGETEAMDTKAIAKSLAKEIKAAKKHLKTSNHEAAWAVLSDGAKTGIASLGENSAVGKWLAESVTEAAGLAGSGESVALLLERIEKSIKALDFKFDDEAPLPKGFPPPTPPGIVEVKSYPKSRVVRKRAAKGKQGSDNSMFMPLFRHIQRNDIAMTAPVETVHSTDNPKRLGTLSMSFLYGDPALGELGPDQDVVVEDAAPIQVVSIGVIGLYNDKNFREPLADLEKWLLKHSDEYTTAGPPRRMGYSSPFVPWYKKFSEVQIPIAPRAKSLTAEPSANVKPGDPEKP